MASTQIPAVITYHKPGTQPPLYVAGTFSDPPWQPFEMDHETRPDGEYDFKKEVRAEPGSKIQYKFRIGDGDWWVLDENGPTITDSSGNKNHVLEVKPQNQPSGEQAAVSGGAQRQQGAGQSAPPSFAQVAARNLEPPTKETATDRSGAGTPITARVAAEVADSAELLHEEVPEREGPKDGAASTDVRKETVPWAAGGAKAPNPRQSAIVVLDPPPGEGRPFEVQPGGGEFSDDQDGYIADKSPLFAHERVGLDESDDEREDEYEEEEYESAPYSAAIEDIDPDSVDLNDPTLERFPSNREDIMDAVRKLETGLPADQSSFDGRGHSPCINPSRRGTEDITGDFKLTAPQASSPTQRSSSRKSPRGSFGSPPAAASLHAISETEEPAAEEEANSRPAVVFTNPLRTKPKRKPQHLTLPTSDDDEAIALRDAVSPRTVKPPRPSIAKSEASLSDSPPSPLTSKKLSSAEEELGKDKERSMQEVKLHPPPSDKPGRAENDPPQAPTGQGASYAEVAALQPSPKEPSENKAEEASQFPSRDIPGESGSPEPPQSQTSGGGAAAAPASDTKDNTTPNPPRARRPSYAEVAASKPGPSTAAKDPSGEEHGKSKTTTAPDPEAAAAGASGPPKASTATTTATSGDGADDKSKQLRKRGGPSSAHHEPAGSSPDSAGGRGGGVPAVQPKMGKGGGWVRAFFRLIFVDFVGGAFQRVLRVFGLGRRSAE